jgi:hypothetical protein
MGFEINFLNMYTHVSNNLYFRWITSHSLNNIILLCVWDYVHMLNGINARKLCNLIAFLSYTFHSYETMMMLCVSENIKSPRTHSHTHEFNSWCWQHHFTFIDLPVCIFGQFYEWYDMMMLMCSSSFLKHPLSTVIFINKNTMAKYHHTHTA